jgi:hypothetical protein
MTAKTDGASFKLAGEELLKSLKKAHWLPFYDVNVIRDTAKEMADHFARLNHLSSLAKLDGADPQQFRAAFMVYQASFWRNRKSVLCYLMYRLEKLHSLRMQVTTDLAPKVKEKLSQNEIKYFKQYSDLLEQYCNTVNVNITTGLLPPSETLIDVRIHQDFDAFEAGKQYFVRSEFVERGILAHKATHLSTGNKN